MERRGEVMTAAPPTTVEWQALETRSLYCRAGKRFADLLVGLALFLLLLPVMTVVTVAIWVTCGRPIFYRSVRLGQNGRVFSMWKFRTMKPDADEILENWKRTSSANWAEYSRNFKVRHDPRVTSIGRFLRRSSLDELPQLWNVLRGDMSLVGPRPYFVHELAPFPSVQQAILLARPGMAGPWQMAGRNKIRPADRIQMDLQYVANESLKKDVLYLLGVLKIVKDFNGL